MGSPHHAVPPYISFFLLLLQRSCLCICRKRRPWEMDALRTDVAIDVQDDDNSWIYQLDKSLENDDAWLNRLNKRVEETDWSLDHRTIYRVPSRLRMVDPNAYEPKILSLGPYHHGKPHLRDMEKLKWRYLKRFLHRNRETCLEDYLKVVAVEEARTREAYSEAPHMDSKNWVEMMLLDSCFAVELLTKPIVTQEYDDEALDPIQSTSWVRPPVLADMLLLENQLPFFLLRKLLELNSLSSGNNRSLIKIVLDTFGDLMPGKVQVSSLPDIDDIHHILHLLYSCTLPNVPPTERMSHHRIVTSYEPSALQWMASAKNLENAGLARRSWNFCVDPLLRKFTRENRSSISNSSRNTSTSSNSSKNISANRNSSTTTSSSISSSSNSINTSYEPTPLQWVASAKNLENAGLSFRKKTKNVRTFMDITFRNGTLEIPPLQIFGQSNSIFRNLIAFEQCYVRNSHPTNLAAYAYLMDCIIDTPVDVDLLQRDGIIVSTLGNDDDIARFFNQLRINAAIDPNSYLSGVFVDVQRHCNKRRNKWKASLNHNYFSNPWAIISLIAAIFLFLLTIMQTVLAFFSYLRPPSP